MGNPLGIVFNPVSLCSALSGKNLTKDGCLERPDGTKHLMCHGNIKAENPTDLIKHLHDVRSAFLQQVNKSKLLIITWGTSQVWKHKEHGIIVANCHKEPSESFESAFLSQEEIVKTWKRELFKLQETNPELQVLVTVSPVRYTRGGLSENTRSKSILHLAARELEKKVSNVTYFPSYEMVIDELRDHRFFKEDLIHPSSAATQHVYGRLLGSIASKDTIAIANQIAHLNRQLDHRYSNEDDAEVKRKEVMRQIKEILG
ncbi:MAG: GSCFA domain-containing protein [Bacteroidota bacterium]